MKFSDKIRQSVTKYLQYLDTDRNVPFKLEDHAWEHFPNLIHASDLMDCPLKAMMERLPGAEPTFPDLSKHNSPTLLMRMQQGTRIAEIIQEAVIWDYTFGITGEYLNAVHEFNAMSFDLCIQGRMDLLVQTLDQQWHVVEIKHRLPTRKNKTSQPRIGDLFQTLAYMHMNEEPYEHGHVIVIDTPAYRDYYDPMRAYSIWNLNPVGNGWQLSDEEGFLFDDAKNIPEYVNMNSMKNNIEYQRKYLLDVIQTPPIDLHDGAAWQCRSIDKKPTETRSGIARVQCAFWCHGGKENITESDERVNHLFEYTVADDGRWNVPWEVF